MIIWDIRKFRLVLDIKMLKRHLLLTMFGLAASQALAGYDSASV